MSGQKRGMFPRHVVTSWRYDALLRLRVCVATHTQRNAAAHRDGVVI